MDRDYWIAGLHLAPDLTDDQIRAEVVARLRLNVYMGGKVPTASQVAFMLAAEPEVLMGGAAGPGKSTGALMLGVQYADLPSTATLIVRVTYQQLSKPGGLMSKAREWFSGTKARWSDETKTWFFPTRDPSRPATVTFGHLEHPGTGPDDLGDETNFQGQEYQTIIVDELTQLATSWPYLYLLSRLRRLKDNPVPVRMRSTTNPGGPGHDWVKERFIDTQHRDRLFIPAKGKDNPHLDWESYLRGLGQMDAVTQAQLIDGNWYVRPSGGLFFTERFRVLESVPDSLVMTRVRSWDKAATANGGAYTVGLRMARVKPGAGFPEWVIEDIVRGQWSSDRREAIIRGTAETDPVGTVVILEQEGGSGGKESAELTVRNLAGFWVEVIRPTGDKETRARPYSVQVNSYNVTLIRAGWNADYIAEIRSCPNGLYWDQIDASSLGFNWLALRNQPALPTSAPGKARELALPSGLPTDPRQRQLPSGIGLPPSLRNGYR